MKRIGLFLLIMGAVFGMMTACESQELPKEESSYWFTQKLEMDGELAKELDGVTIRDVVFIIWEGKGVEYIHYNYFKYEESKIVSDEDIMERLTKELEDKYLNKLENGEKVNVYFIGEPETEYEIVSLATFVDGTTKLCRDLQMTNDSLPNRFEQALRLPNSNYTMEVNMPDNTIHASYDGYYVKSVKNGIFPASESSEISDKDIVEMLTYEFTREEIIGINNPSTGPCCFYYENLEFETIYEVVAFATFDDGKTQLVRGEITTGKE